MHWMLGTAVFCCLFVWFWFFIFVYVITKTEMGKTADRSDLYKDHQKVSWTCSVWNLTSNRRHLRGTWI